MLETVWPNKCVLRQYFAGLVVNLFVIVFGIHEGWSSPMNLLYTSDKSPLPSGKITMEEASWATSLLSIGATISNIVFGFVANRLGAKMSLIIFSAPMIISWLLLWFAQDPFYLYASRLIAGFIGGAGYLIGPLWLSEIVDNRLRGAFLSSIYTSENFGILLAYLIGNYFDYYAMPLIAIILTSICSIFVLIIPESATFHVRQNNIDQAKKSICFYKNKDQTSEKNSREIELEIEKIKRALDQNNSEMMEHNQWTPETVAIARKAIVSGLVLVVLFIYSGVTPMSFYTASIFQETGSNLSPNMSAIVIGTIQLIGTCTAIQLVECVGRKILLVVSCFGTATSLIVLGVYMMLKTWGIPVEVVNWVPLVSYSAASFISGIGIQALSYSVMYEIAPEKIKESFTSFCMTFSWVLSFTSTKYLPYLLDVLGFHSSMYLFAGVCILSAIYIMFYVPETKGKSNEQIMEYYTSKTAIVNQ